MNQLTLDDFALFVLIARQQNLSAVARERDVPPSQVSRALARIELKCGVQLVNRTTHGLSLTDDGETFLEAAQRVLTEQSDLQSQLADRRGTVAGLVRIGISQLFAEYVVLPQLPMLLNRHPNLRIEVRINDRILDMASEAVDVVVRGGVPAADTLIAKPLGNHGRALYASGAYVKSKGLPAHPDELKKHTLIANLGVVSHNRWKFLVGGEEQTQTVAGDVRVNSSASVVSLALAGAGIARLNDVIGAALVAEGRLKPVLPEFAVAGSYPVYAAVLAHRHRAPRIRATVAFLQDCFAGFR
jgi:LysR family transcriptional regulator for bpeEF and oprC